MGEAQARGMDLTPLGEGCGVGSLGPATTGSGVFGTSEITAAKADLSLQNAIPGKIILSYKFFSSGYVPTRNVGMVLTRTR